MAINSVYVILAEVTPLPGSQFDPAVVAGAWVRCYVPAESDKQARNMLKAALSRERLGLVQIRWCCDYNETEWDNKDDSTGKQMITDARISRQVIFGVFNTWSPDAPDAEDRS